MSKFLKKQRRKKTASGGEFLPAASLLSPTPPHARDSGIVEDGSDDSIATTTTTSNRSSMQFIPSQQVRNRIQCFEFLAHESNYHTNPNWWLEESRRETIRKEEEEKNRAKEEENSVENVRISLPNVILTVDESESASDEDEEEVEEEIKEGLISDEEEEEEIVNLRNSKEMARLSRPASITSQISNLSSSKLFNIIRELQANEQNYVRSLQNGIKNYMSVMDEKDLPRTLRGQKFKVFGNIYSIYKFHADEFYPKLYECGDDVEQIAELFTSYVTRDYFYSYVIYAINRKRSELLCNYHGQFFKEVQNNCGDRLGINSFLLQPIQRLPRYQLLLNEIIKDLSKDLDNTAKRTIAACCVAEKNIQRLLDTVNESMSINDIRNCFEIDIFCQGKFKKMNEFEIYDWEIRRRFRGKVFLFEGCVVYTEELEREYLEFRGCYASDKLGIIYKEGKSKFKLFAKKPGHKEVEFHADLNIVVEWKTSLFGMLMDFAASEKKRNASNSEMRRKNSTIKTRLLPDSVRSSNVSNLSNFSMGSYGSVRSSTSSGRSSNIEPRQSHWYV